MAERAEMFSLAPFHALSPPACRPPQDISLEEFDDEDLSEITDDCGIGLNYDSDHYEKDGLVLERSEQPHPICTFPEEFQEFEMIDDEDEEEPDGPGLDAPPSPSASPIPSPSTQETHKPRPSTLSLSAPGAQDSLNNNGSYPPPPPAQRATWQETLRHSSSSSSHTGHLSPSHPCVQDGPCQDSRRGLGLSPEEGGQAPALLTPSLYDSQGNRHEALAHGNQAPHRAGEDYNMNLTSSAPCSPHPPAPLRRPPAKPPLSPTGPATPHPAPCSQPRATESHGPELAQESRKPREEGSPAGGETGRGSPSTLLGQASTPLSEEEPPKSPGDAGARVFADGREGAGGGAHACLRGLSEQLSSEGEGPRGSRAASLRGLPSGSSETTSPSSDPGIEADLTSRNSKPFLPRGRRGEALSSPGSDSDVEGEIEAAFACGGRLASNMISSISETELDLSSGSSSGRSSHLTNSIEEASSPTSEAELEPEPEPEGQGVMGIKDALLLAQRKQEEEGALDGELPESRLSMVRRESLADLKMEGYYDTLNPEDSSAPLEQTDVSGSSPLDLKIDPDHSLESIRRSFYLPVGPQLLPEVAGEGTSEYDSDSESEPDLSEDSDSPWLLSNLVNKMISEGSYPLRCPDECFQGHSLCDTISPASDLEPEGLEGLPQGSPGSQARRGLQACCQQSIELVDMETLRSSLQGAADEKPTSTSPAPQASPPASDSGPCLFLSNPTNDTITPVFLGQPAALNRLAMLGCCTGPVQTFPFGAPSTQASEPAPGAQGTQAEPAPGTEAWAVDKDLDSGILEDSDLIDDVRLASLARSPEAFLPGLDVSTAKTNRGFTLSYSAEEDEAPYFGHLKGSPFPEAAPSFEEDQLLPPLPVGLEPRAPDESLAYDSIKYTLVVDENTQLELVSLKHCTSVLSDDSELLRACEPEEDDEEFGEGLTAQDGLSSSEDSSPEADLHFSKKFLNVFVNSTSRSSSTESFGLFSCMVNGEEREQTHRAVFRFVPRHEDELELDVDDPVLVELEEDDYWYRGYNMRTGERGIFPAFYAHEVLSQAKEVVGLKRRPCWVERFNVQFLGSVEVPYHQGNGILCAAMQKIATTRKLTVHLRPPATCDLEITLQGIKLILSVNEDSRDDELERCSHFFQMKNISFCGCHPRNCCYFGFITKHPLLSRFACHVFVSQESMRHVAECVGRAFQEYYQEHLEYACPTEDIYLE